MTQPVELTPRIPKRKLPRLQETGLIIVVVLLSLFLWLQSSDVKRTLLPKQITDAAGNVTQTLPMRVVHENSFLRIDNLIPSVFTEMSWMAVMSIGMTIVIISGGIDISVGSIMGVAAIGCAGALLALPENASSWLVLLVGIGVPVGIGLGCGLVNGLLVVGLRMHPFIVTLATLSIFRWIPLKTVPLGSLPSGDRNLPAAFTDNFIAWTVQYPKYGGQANVAIELVPVLIMLGCLFLGWVYLRHTVWGRETYAVGGNEEASRFSGLRVNWIKVRVYLISGLTAGLAGMLSCGFYKSAITNTGQGYELTVVAAAVVGGASLIGGRGTALGAVLGMLVLQLIIDGISVIGKVNLGLFSFEVNKIDSQLIFGIAIIVAVAVDQLSEYLHRLRSSLRVKTK